MMTYGMGLTPAWRPAFPNSIMYPILLAPMELQANQSMDKNDDSTVIMILDVEDITSTQGTCEIMNIGHTRT